ncbi:MAG: hypothetical protein V7642_733 [Burkholderiales bacterium]|jgi:hypothetical protein
MTPVDAVVAETRVIGLAIERIERAGAASRFSDVRIFEIDGPVEHGHAGSVHLFSIEPSNIDSSPAMAEGGASYPHNPDSQPGFKPPMH